MDKTQAGKFIQIPPMYRQITGCKTLSSHHFKPVKFSLVYQRCGLNNVVTTDGTQFSDNWFRRMLFGCLHNHTLHFLNWFIQAI